MAALEPQAAARAGERGQSLAESVWCQADKKQETSSGVEKKSWRRRAFLYKEGFFVGGLVKSMSKRYYDSVRQKDRKERVVEEKGVDCLGLGIVLLWSCEAV